MKAVMATPAVTPYPPYPHITKTPGVCGGKACIAGTRIRVMDIVALHNQGILPEQMIEHYSSRPLTPAEIHSALAYYYDHEDEIEASFEEDRKNEAEQEGRKEEYRILRLRRWHEVKA
jgi:uncharacterized protein (DUF433 family)